jgi:predicted transcriptional regulator
MSVQDLRPQYREYAKKILEYLATGTGITYRSKVQKDCKIPNSSMTEVLKVLEKDRLVDQKPSFRKRNVLEITSIGKQFYEDICKFPRHFKLPHIVEKYLRKRGVNSKNLFPVQHKFVERGLIHSANNVCVFGYPRTGKTLICEMLISNEIEREGKSHIRADQSEYA